MDGLYESQWGLEIDENRTQNVNINDAIDGLKREIDRYIEGTSTSRGPLEKQGLKVELDENGRHYIDTSMPVGHALIEDRTYLPIPTEHENGFDLNRVLEYPDRIIRAAAAFDPLSYSGRILDKAHPEGLSAEEISNVMQNGFDLAGSLYAAAKTIIGNLGLNDHTSEFEPSASVQEWLKDSMVLVPMVYNGMNNPDWNSAFNIAEIAAEAVDPDVTFKDVEGKSIGQIKEMLAGSDVADVLDDKRIGDVASAIQLAAESRDVMGYYSPFPMRDFDLSNFSPVQNMIEESLYRVDDVMVQAGLELNAVDKWNGEEQINTISMTYGDDGEYTMTYQFAEFGPVLQDIETPEWVACVDKDLPSMIIEAVNNFDIDRFKILSPDTPVEEFQDRLEQAADWLAEEFNLARNPENPISVSVVPKEEIPVPQDMNVKFSPLVNDRMMSDPKFGSFVMESVLKYQGKDWGNVNEYVGFLNDADPGNAEGLYGKGNQRIAIKNEDRGAEGVVTSVAFSNERSMNLAEDFATELPSFKEIKARHKELTQYKHNKQMARTRAD